MNLLENLVSSLNTNRFAILRSFRVPLFKLFSKYRSATMLILSALNSTPKLINVLNVCWPIVLTITNKSATNAELFTGIFAVFLSRISLKY